MPRMASPPQFTSTSSFWSAIAGVSRAASGARPIVAHMPKKTRRG